MGRLDELDASRQPVMMADLPQDEGASAALHEIHVVAIIGDAGINQYLRRGSIGSSPTQMSDRSPHDARPKLPL